MGTGRIKNGSLGSGSRVGADRVGLSNFLKHTWDLRLDVVCRKKKAKRFATTAVQFYFAFIAIS